MRPRGRPSEQGLTLIEQMTVLALTGILLIPVLRFVVSSRNSILRAQVGAELLERNSRVGANLRSGLLTTNLLLADYGGSPDYSQLRDRVKSSASATGSPVPVSFSASPVAVNSQAPELITGSAGANAAAWGNELVYVSHLSPVTFTACYSGSCASPTTATVRETLSIDRMQLVYLYLSQDSKAPVPGSSLGLRLTEWRSQPYINYSSLSPFVDGTLPRRSTAITYLYNQGYRYALDMNQLEAPDDAFYALGPGSPATLSNTGAWPNPLPRGSWGYVEEYELAQSLRVRPGADLGRIVRSGGGGRQTGPASYVTAFNTVNPTVNPTFKVNRVMVPGRPQATVPAFAQPDRGGLAGFPGGFEVGVFGRPGSRMMVLRHVLMGISASDPNAGPKSWAAHETVVQFAVPNEQ